ncbi:hypothetical protein [Qipengyuania sp. 902]|uniref:hypothetical protein n=1 Tax=Qipengyuania sp. 902 TaxID=3417565 RepID=UPI003EBDBDE3
MIRATAINFSKPNLDIVTLYRGRSGEIAIDDKRTAQLQFASREASELEVTRQAIIALLSEWRICRLALRVGADRGAYLLNPLAYKLEAALQLTPRLRLDCFTVAEVAGFGRRHSDDLPEPQTRCVGSAGRSSQLNAIRTAGLSMFLAEGLA